MGRRPRDLTGHGGRFRCAPGYEPLAAEMAGLVDGSWELATGSHGMGGSHSATVASELTRRRTRSRPGGIGR